MTALFKANRITDMSTTGIFLSKIDDFISTTGIPIARLNKEANKHHGLLYRYRSGESIPTAKTIDDYLDAMERLSTNKSKESQ